MTKTNEGRIKELDFVHTEWGDTVHVADVVTLLIEKDKEREEAVKEEREFTIKIINQLPFHFGDSGFGVFIDKEDLLKALTPDQLNNERE